MSQASANPTPVKARALRPQAARSSVNSGSDIEYRTAMRCAAGDIHAVEREYCLEPPGLREESS